MLSAPVAIFLSVALLVFLFQRRQAGISNAWAASERRFGGLFRARHSEPVSLPKETLLKPLLEKIALCR